MVHEIGLLCEMATVVSAKQHRESGDLEAGEMFGTDAVDAPTIDADPRHLGDTRERQTGQVVTVGEAVERHVDVRSGVRADGDHPDREGDACSVDGFGRLAVEVFEDVGSG